MGAGARGMGIVRVLLIDARVIGDWLSRGHSLRSRRLGGRTSSLSPFTSVLFTWALGTMYALYVLETYVMLYVTIAIYSVPEDY